MGRIRTIKPEFPLSESLWRVSREARLLYVNLWTIADDEGRFRASSRILASLLYPADDDALGLIDGWLDDLGREGHVRLYDHEGVRFGDMPNWLKHQKIDHPSKSRIPAFSGVLANPREPSRVVAPLPRIGDLGSGTVDRGSGTKEIPGAPPALPGGVGSGPQVKASKKQPKEPAKTYHPAEAFAPGSTGLGQLGFETLVRSPHWPAILGELDVVHRNERPAGRQFVALLNWIRPKLGQELRAQQAGYGRWGARGGQAKPAGFVEPSASGMAKFERLQREADEEAERRDRAASAEAGR